MGSTLLTARDRELFDPRVPAHDVGDIIGFTPDGSPIRMIGGGARANFDAWNWEEFGADVIQQVRQNSAVEAVAQRIPMRSQTRSTPRSGGVELGIVAKGGAYGEDTSPNDEVILSAQKFGTAIRIAEEDIDDSLANVLNTKLSDWATAYAKGLDNACLAVTAAKASTGCKFDSLYYMLSQNNSDTGYTANSNITKTGSGGTTYGSLSATLGKVETSDYWVEGAGLWIASPEYKQILRDIVDDNDRPIFAESTGGDSAGAANVPDRIMGYPVRWSLGARTSAVPTSRPSGNPLMIFVIPQLMMLGIRSGPESIYIDGRNGLAALTDESILKLRARRAFNVGHEKGFAIHEDNS
ncbi:phage major capsid protein [Saccharothrix xinjiangensis]|uniref:Phage major capsid protein n=1 Tax=Saccharothrix xinjiangensis TaxID=204798 RepID=A0ABV9XWL9_9PSEU